MYFVWGTALRDKHVRKNTHRHNIVSLEKKTPVCYSRVGILIAKMKEKMLSLEVVEGGEAAGRAMLVATIS